MAGTAKKKAVDIKAGAKSGGEIEKILKDWLSDASSQMTALEVISKQIPELNKLLETNIGDLSNSFSILATQAQSQSKNIGEVVEAATTIYMDGSAQNIRDVLYELEEKMDDKEFVEKTVKSLIEASKKQDKKLKEAMEVAEVSSDEMLTAVSSAIVGMQFQDRVSQNLVIAEKVTGGIADQIRGIITMAVSSLGDVSDKDINKDLAKEIITLLTLGELQHKFAERLIENGYIKDSSELGFDADGATQKEDDDSVELF